MVNRQGAWLSQSPGGGLVGSVSHSPSQLRCLVFLMRTEHRIGQVGQGLQPRQQFKDVLARGQGCRKRAVVLCLTCLLKRPSAWPVCSCMLETERWHLHTRLGQLDSSSLLIPHPGFYHKSFQSRLRASSSMPP